MKKLFLIVTIFSVISCSRSTDIENIVDGLWSIDTIYYNNNDVKHCFNINILQFKFKGNSELPIANGNCVEITKNSSASFGIVTISKSHQRNDTIPYRLNIKSENKMFAGSHKIVFYNDDINKLLKMELFSENLYIVCRKGLYNYNTNISEINKLRDITWTTHP